MKFVGIPTAPTAITGTNTTQIATTAFVQQEMSGAGLGDMLKTVYDTDNDGKVNAAENADTVGGFTVAKSVPSDAVFTDTVYTHPDTHSADIITDGTTNKAYTATEKIKLSGIDEGANNYTHPTTSGNKHIPSGGSSGQVLTYSADGTAAWGDAGGGDVIPICPSGVVTATWSESVNAQSSVTKTIAHSKGSVPQRVKLYFKNGNNTACVDVYYNGTAYYYSMMGNSNGSPYFSVWNKNMVTNVNIFGTLSGQTIKVGSDTLGNSLFWLNDITFSSSNISISIYNENSSATTLTSNVRAEVF